MRGADTKSSCLHQARPEAVMMCRLGGRKEEEGKEGRRSIDCLFLPKRSQKSKNQPAEIAWGKRLRGGPLRIDHIQRNNTTMNSTTIDRKEHHVGSVVALISQWRALDLLTDCSCRTMLPPMSSSIAQAQVPRLPSNSRSLCLPKLQTRPADSLGLHRLAMLRQYMLFIRTTNSLRTNATRPSLETALGEVLVISGGSGFNDLVGATPGATYVMPISDNGGSSSEIIRVPRRTLHRRPSLASQPPHPHPFTARPHLFIIRDSTTPIQRGDPQPALLPPPLPRLVSRDQAGMDGHPSKDATVYGAVSNPNARRSSEDSSSSSRARLYDVLIDNSISAADRSGTSSSQLRRSSFDRSRVRSFCFRNDADQHLVSGQQGAAGDQYESYGYDCGRVGGWRDHCGAVRDLASRSQGAQEDGEGDGGMERSGSLTGQPPGTPSSAGQGHQDANLLTADAMHGLGLGDGGPSTPVLDPLRTSRSTSHSRRPTTPR